MGAMGQDPFQGHEGNALQAFYQKLTPAYLVSEVQHFVNESYLGAWLKLLQEKEYLSEDVEAVDPVTGRLLSDAGKAFFKVENVYGEEVFASATFEGVRKILVEYFKILKETKPQEEGQIIS
jgi:hypothetical protein